MTEIKNLNPKKVPPAGKENSGDKISAHDMPAPEKTEAFQTTADFNEKKIVDQLNQIEMFDKQIIKTGKLLAKAEK